MKKDHTVPGIESLIDQLEENINEHFGLQYLIDLQAMSQKDRKTYCDMLRGTWYAINQKPKNKKK